MQVFKKKILQ